MKQKLLDWIYRCFFDYDPKVQKFIVQVAKKYGLSEKDYPTLIDQMTDQELSDFLFILRGCPEPDENWEGADVFYNYDTLSFDKRAKQLFDMVKKRIEFRQKQVKRQKFSSFDWDNLIINESFFRLSCKKEEMGRLGKMRINISANQIDGFPTHYLVYSLGVNLGGEEVLLDNKWQECRLVISTNEEETKWLKKHRNVVSFNPCIIEPPEPLFKDDYYRQKYDDFRPLPSDTKQRIKDFLCGVEDDNPEENQFENPDLIKPILEVLVYNHLLKRKLELDKQYVIDRIKREHIKEKIYYRLKHVYPKLKLRTKSLLM